MIFHMGDFMVGSAEAVPQAQIRYLTESGFVVVVPNYRLAPIVSAKQAFEDCEDAYEWAVGALPAAMQDRVGLTLDPTKVVAMGHSSGGTIALHLASCKPLHAVTAFYPSLYLSDMATSANQPGSPHSFDEMPDCPPQDEERSSIQPEGRQVSEEPLALSGTHPSARVKWQMHIIKSGKWMSTVQPDGDFSAIDPLTRLNVDWPPVMIVQGEKDERPGSSLELAQRAEREIRDAGVEVALEFVAGEDRAFDLALGASEPGDLRWAAVVKGLEWLKQDYCAVKRPSNERCRVPQLDVHIRYI